MKIERFQKTQQNSGFTLVEVLIAVIVSTILFAGLIFAYKSLWTLNGFSLKKDQSANIASSIIENLSTKRYSDLTEESIGVLVPNGFDLSESEVTITNGENGDKWIEIGNIQGDTYSYKAKVHITLEGLEEENEFMFSDVKYFDDYTNCVVSLNSESNTFHKTDEIFDKNWDGSYVRDYENYYDTLAYQSFLNKHLSYVNSIYVEEYSRITMHNGLNPNKELPLPSLDDYESIFTEENYISYFKDVVKRCVYIDILNNGNYIDLTARLVYTLDDAMAQGVVDIINNTTNLHLDSLLGDYSKMEEIYLLRNSTFYDMKSLILEYEPTMCYEDNVKISNKTTNLLYGDKTFDMYVYVSEDFSDINKTQAHHNIDLNSFEFEQDLPSKLVNVYTNSPTIQSYLNLCGTLKSVNLKSTKKAEATTRMYNVSITIEDGSGTNVYSVVESNVLKY